jgi:hypothetical protein
MNTLKRKNKKKKKSFIGSVLKPICLLIQQQLLQERQMQGH